jgi:hypothetical protein
MNVMKFFYTTFMIVSMIVSVSACIAQSSRIEGPRLAVKWSSLHLIHFYPSIQIGVEHVLLKNVRAQYDVGLVVDRLGTDEEYENCRGFRGIGEIRYYIPSPPKIPFYIAGEFYYSDIKFDRTNVAGYDCQGEHCLYYEYLTYTMTHGNQGAGLKYGILLFPGWNRNRSFFFDINVGIAYRSITYRRPATLPANITIFEDDNDDFLSFRPSEDNRREFRPVVGIRLGYAFVK